MAGYGGSCAALACTSGYWQGRAALILAQVATACVIATDAAAAIPPARRSAALSTAVSATSIETSSRQTLVGGHHLLVAEIHRGEEFVNLAPQIAILLVGLRQLGAQLFRDRVALAAHELAQLALLGGHLLLQQLAPAAKDQAPD
eukprot:scaffold1001_cov334-Prasinococcus_capsulatus_cf.AAC.8